jgi:hypothetical protein
MLGCSSANRPRRLTSHFAAKSGDVLTVRAPGTLALEQSLGAERDAVEGIPQDGEVLTPGLCDDKALALAVEELDPELLLQGLDLVAYRALGDEQLLGRPREALVAGGGLEGLQSIEVGAAGARDPPHEKNSGRVE